MKLSSMIWLLPLALLALIVYVGASALRGAPRTVEKPPVAADPNAAEFPRTLIENGGHEVVIQTRPMRIVPSDCGPADMLSALVDPTRIAALPQTVDTYGAAQDFYRARADIQRYAKFTSETMLELKPDLVLFTTYREPAIAAYLESHGITVVRFENFKTFDGICGAILAVGHATGDDAKARAAVEEFDRRLKAVETAVAGKKRPRTLGYSNYGQGSAVGTGESQDEVIRRAGADNAAAEMNLSGHPNFTFEQLLRLNPDWIVVGGDKGLESTQAQLLLSQAELSGLKAIQERHIAVIPDRYYSSISQYVVEAVEILAKQLHSDAFEK